MLERYLTPYLLPPLIEALFSTALIFIVLWWHRQSFVHRLFSLFLLTLTLWGIGIFGMRASPDVGYAYYWERGLLPVSVFMSVLFFHFAVSYTDTRVREWLLTLLYIVCFLFIPLFLATKYILVGMQIKSYGYAPILGPATPLWILFEYGMMTAALVVFIRSYRRTKNAEQKNRFAYIIAGLSLCFVGIAFDLLPVAGLPLYPGGIIGNIFFCLLVTIAIMKHNLLDIHVVLRKSFAYILTSAVVAVPFVAIFLLATRVFREGKLPLWTYFVAAIVLALVLPQLWQWFQRWVERWYYRDRYDYLQALENFSQQTQSLTNTSVLGRTMVSLIAKALRSSNVYLLQPLHYGSDFVTAFSIGINSPAPDIQLNKGSALVNWLGRPNSLLSYEDIEIIPQLQGITLRERETLEQVGAKLLCPLKTPSGKLAGILVLGQKLSEQPYSSEDKQLIYTVCNQMSTNLENIRLYNESRQEVKERKRAEQELQAEKNKLSSVIDAIGDFLTIRDKHYNLLYQNELAKRIFGDCIGEKCYRVFENQDSVCEGCPVEKAFKYGNSHTAERRGVTPSGEIIFFENTASPVRDAKGEVIACLEIARSINERKRAEIREKELQRELYLSSRLASIGELAAGVAHQLNNPLTGVLGFSQRLMRKSADLEANQDLKRIYSEAERAAKIVQNLLTFARQRQPHKQYADINKILENALELRAYELKTANIELVTDLAPKLPQIMLDYHQIQEVFLNIILNAEQAMTAGNLGGKLTIKTDKNKGHVRAIFTDNGPGIPPEHLDRIFDPFYTTKGGKGGTGLGLSICHGIITEHGGKIYANSKPGKETTFFVELPIRNKMADKHSIEKT